MKGLRKRRRTSHCLVSVSPGIEEEAFMVKSMEGCHMSKWTGSIERLFQDVRVGGSPKDARLR